MKEIIDQITDQVSDEKRIIHPQYKGHPELLAVDIAKAAPLEFLVDMGYEGLWEAAAALRLPPSDSFLLKEHIKLIKLGDIIREKSGTHKAEQQGLFPEGAA